MLREILEGNEVRFEETYSTNIYIYSKLQTICFIEISLKIRSANRD